MVIRSRDYCHGDNEPVGPQQGGVPEYQQVPDRRVQKERQPLKCAPQDVMHVNKGKDSIPDTHKVPEMVSHFVFCLVPRRTSSMLHCSCASSL